MRTQPDQAIDIYLKVNDARTDRALLRRIVTDPAVQFKIAPQNTLALGQFMHRVGVIRHQPQSIKDYFFEDVLGAAAN